MTHCAVMASGTIEVYFYGELPADRRAQVDAHLATCADCRALLEDLSEIRNVVDDRFAAFAPPGGDWSGFMARLAREIPADARRARDNFASDDLPHRPRFAAGTNVRHRRWSPAGLVAAAALLSLVGTGVNLAMRSRFPSSPPVGAASVPGGVRQRPDGEPGFAALSGEHFGRSKLVVLGLAAKDSARATSADWTYERELAGRLLSDTRLYRMAAEDRGLLSIAGVMRDLELVLIQASFTDAADPEALSRIQGLIRRRDLVAKMDVVAMAGS